MKTLKDKMRTEALKRIKELEKEFILRPNIYKYFNEGNLYYSYLNLGIRGCIDTINYDKRYARVVDMFEEEYEYLVYHVIETGNTIALLYVGKNEEDWECERLFDNQYLPAYVYNFNDPDCSEFGDIVVSSNAGALTRIG